MPLNVRGICISLFLVAAASSVSFSQTVAPSPQAETAPVQMAAPAPTSGEVMRSRISKAKAFIAVRNYSAAIYELENIRRESGDPALHSVVNVLLMNSYLEQGDYKRAQDFLNQVYNEQKTTKAGAAANYAAVSGQVIKGARSRAERYKALGLSISDRTLPLEALNDLEKMRETVEIVITQAKEMGKSAKKPADSMMLLEEATTSRAMIARDDYDAKNWRDAVADTREEMANSRSVVMNAVGDMPQEQNVVAQQVNTSQIATNIPPAVAPPTMQPVVDKPAPQREREVKQDPDTTVAKGDSPASAPTLQPEPKADLKVAVPAKTESAKLDAPASASTGPLDVGAQLKEFATKQTTPVYPPMAKSMRTTGIVKVEVTINESGEVTDVQKASGPSMLQSAAKDAIRKWKFKPFLRDGQPVKAVGYINFNFSL